MKRHILKLYVFLIFVVFAMVAVSCGKADTTNKITDTKESSGDNAKPTESIKPTINAEPTSSAEPTVKTEPTSSAEPTENVEPTENTETSESTESSDNTELLEDSGAIEYVEPTVYTEETIKETVLFDRDGIRMTAKEIIIDMWGKGINVLIENDTDKNIGIMINSLVVNNYMIDEFFACNLAPRTQTNETLSLSSPNITGIGITTVAEVFASFHVFDNDSGDTLFYTEEVSIPTSAYGMADQPVIEDGKELLNQNGVRIVGKYVDANSSWGTGVLVYIENTSEEDVVVQCDSMTVNEFEISPYFSCKINKGRRVLDAISILDSDLQDNNIKEIKNLGLTFGIVNPTTYFVIYISEPIQLSARE